jgi:enoyl-CoA hydratase/3-hydroxyacyl-CoA dehydrogenase
VTTAFANPLLARPTRAAPRHVAVVGAGSIGPDIAYYLKSALPGLQTDAARHPAGRRSTAALERLTGYADKAVARGKMDADDRAGHAGRSGGQHRLRRAGATATG